MEPMGLPGLRLVVACLVLGVVGCSKGEVEPKNDDLKNLKLENENGGVRGDVGTRDEPFDAPAKRTRDPKVIAQWKAEAKKQQRLQELCFAALKKETRAKAVAELEAHYPDIAVHVVTLAVDESPDQIKNACETFRGLGPKVKGAWPVVAAGLARLLAADIKSAEPWRNEPAEQSALFALAAIAPDETEVLHTLAKIAELADITERRLRDGRPVTITKNDYKNIRATAALALGKSAGGNTAAKQLRIITEGLGKALKDTTISEDAAKALGEAARGCPQARSDTVAVIMPALKSPIVQKNDSTRRALVESLAQCGVAVTTAATDALRDIKINDTSGDVRTAASSTLVEVDRQKRIVPQLTKVRIIEGTIPTSLYTAAFELVEGREEAKKTLSAAPRDDDTWFVLAMLTALPKNGNQDHVDTRQFALAELSDWVAKDSKRRGDGAVVFEAALYGPTLVGEAIECITRCGPEGVRRLRASKAPVDRLPIYRAWLRNEESSTRAAAAEAFGDLRFTNQSDLGPVLSLLESSQPPEVSRAAAKSLSHLGPDQSSMADLLMKKIVKIDDAETQKTLRQIVRKMGFESSSLIGFQASVVGNKTADPNLRRRVVESVDDTAAFAKEADAKAQQAFVSSWLVVTKPSFTSTDVKQRAAYSTYARKMCQAFGKNAEELAPILTDDLKAHLKGGPHVFAPLAAVVALEAIGPVSGTNARGVLESVAASSSERAVREAAARALQKHK